MQASMFFGGGTTRRALLRVGVGPRLLLAGLALLPGAAGPGSAADCLGDPVVILRYLYLGETAPAAPFGSCGFDRTADDLGCEAFAPCEGST